MKSLQLQKLKALINNFPIQWHLASLSIYDLAVTFILLANMNFVEIIIILQIIFM